MRKVKVKWHYTGDKPDPKELRMYDVDKNRLMFELQAISMVLTANTDDVLYMPAKIIWLDLGEYIEGPWDDKISDKFLSGDLKEIEEEVEVVEFDMRKIE